MGTEHGAGAARRAAARPRPAADRAAHAGARGGRRRWSTPPPRRSAPGCARRPAPAARRRTPRPSTATSSCSSGSAWSGTPTWARARRSTTPPSTRTCTSSASPAARSPRSRPTCSTAPRNVWRPIWVSPSTWVTSRCPGRAARAANEPDRSTHERLTPGRRARARSPLEDGVGRRPLRRPAARAAAAGRGRRAWSTAATGTSSPSRAPTG